MAEIVGGFLVPHTPLIPSEPDAADPAQARTVFAAFDRVSQRVGALRADTVITIGDDHYGLFGPHCVPACLIAIGDVEGPIEDWLGFPRAPIENNAPLARHILATGNDDGIDWSFATSLVVDHSAAVPHHYCVKRNPGVRTIPIYLNDGVPPVIPSARARRIGESIAHAVSTWDGPERVVVLGTGGISHWVGSAEMGRVNEAFDRKVLALAEAGDIDALIALQDAEILSDGGNGALEIKNFICAMATMRGAKAQVIAYEAIPQWISGIGFAELTRAA